MPGRPPTVALYNSDALKAQLLNEQAQLIRNRCCVTCGLPVMDCWCGEYNRYDESPLAGSDWEPVE